MIAAGLLLAAQEVADMVPTELAISRRRHQLVEGVASDGRHIFVSSVIDRIILRCPRRTSLNEPRCHTFAVLPPGLHPLGITWDRWRRRLWVAADCPDLPGVSKCERGALLSLRTSGRRSARLAPRSGSFHPGDVSAAPQGVFVSDGSNGAVYRLGARSKLQTLVAPGVGRSAQGSVVDPTGRTLIVADYSQGLTQIDLRTGQRRLLPRADGTPIRGLDGLIRCGATYLAIDNGSSMGRLLTIELKDGYATAWDILATRMYDGTQLALDGRRLLVVSGSGWSQFGKDHVKLDFNAIIDSVPLAACRPHLGDSDRKRVATGVATAKSLS